MGGRFEDLRWQLQRGLLVCERFYLRKSHLMGAAVNTSKAIVALSLVPRSMVLASINACRILDGVGDGALERLDAIHKGAGLMHGTPPDKSPPPPGYFLASPPAILVALLEAEEDALKGALDGCVVDKDGKIHVTQAEIVRRARMICTEHFEPAEPPPDSPPPRRKRAPKRKTGAKNAGEDEDESKSKEQLQLAIEEQQRLQQQQEQQKAIIKKECVALKRINHLVGLDLVRVCTRNKQKVYQLTPHGKVGRLNAMGAVELKQILLESLGVQVDRTIPSVKDIAESNFRLPPELVPQRGRATHLQNPAPVPAESQHSVDCANPQVSEHSVPVSVPGLVGGQTQAPYGPQIHTALYHNDNGSDGVIVLVDAREFGGDQHKLRNWCETLNAMRVRYQTSVLPTSDYVWIYRKNGEEKCLPVLFERKRADDFALSMKDGRYTRQKNTMLYCYDKYGFRDLRYCVEGQFAHWALPSCCGRRCVSSCGCPNPEDCEALLAELRTDHRFTVAKTDTALQTAACIYEISTLLESCLKSGTLKPTPYTFGDLKGIISKKPKSYQPSPPMPHAKRPVLYATGSHATATDAAPSSRSKRPAQSPVVVLDDESELHRVAIPRRSRTTVSVEVLDDSYDKENGASYRADTSTSLPPPRKKPALTETKSLDFENDTHNISSDGALEEEVEKYEEEEADRHRLTEEHGGTDFEAGNEISRSDILDDDEELPPSKIFSSSVNSKSKQRFVHPASGAPSPPPISTHASQRGSPAALDTSTSWINEVLAENPFETHSTFAGFGSTKHAASAPTRTSGNAPAPSSRTAATTSDPAGVKKLCV